MPKDTNLHSSTVSADSDSVVSVQTGKRVTYLSMGHGRPGEPQHAGRTCMRIATNREALTPGILIGVHKRRSQQCFRASAEKTCGWMISGINDKNRALMTLIRFMLFEGRFKDTDSGMALIVKISCDAGDRHVINLCISAVAKQKILFWQLLFDEKPF